MAHENFSSTVFNSWSLDPDSLSASDPDSRVRVERSIIMKFDQSVIGNNLFGLGGAITQVINAT